MNMDGSGDFTCKSDGNQTVVKEHQSSTSTVALKQLKQDKNLPSYEEVSVKNNISFININNIDNNKLNKMGKHNGTSDVDKDDEAQERMLKDDVKVSIVPSKETSDVKFISENGDAKIDIKNVKQSLSGMGKAELMKYANDPFWVYLRWFFFIAFWLLWIAMLAGAIAIVVMAPKCSAPEPKKWYEESPIIKIDLAEDDVKDLQDLSKVLDNLKEQNIKAISLNSVFKQSTQGSPENFKEVNPKLGKIEDFQLFLKTAKDNKQHVIMEFDPNHSSNMHEWFIKSENKEEPYTSFYIWADGKIDNEDKSRKPPNEWKNVENQSAWKYSSKRNQYYLHQFKETQPDLNYHNSNVTDAITDALKFWLNLGISGFNFINTQFLTEDPDLLDNPLTTSLHAPKIRTEGRADNNKLILKEWRQVILNYTEGQGLLSLNEELSNDTFIVYNDEKNGNVLVNLPKTVNILRFSNPLSIAKSLKDNVDRMLKSSKWPSFELFNKKSLENNNRNAEVSESLAIMALLLPATPIMKYNEFMSLNTSKALNTLVKARSGLSFLHGKTETYVLNNGTVFAYTRLKSGNPGYLVAYNSGENKETMDISKIPIVPEEVNIATYSLNYNTHNTIHENKLDSKSVFMPPKSTLVVTFAPKL